MLEHVELKDIGGFVQIARSGSLTRAAREAGVPKATLSHNLRRLEDALGVELFIRGARGLTLTDAGKAFHEHCKRIFDSCEVAVSAAQRAHSSISGKIRLSASAEFGTSILGAATLYLAREFPGLEFEVRMYPSDTLLTDLHDFDCLIFVGTPPDSSYMCRKMGEVTYRIYASPEFFEQHGVPPGPDSIANLPGVQYTRNGISEVWLLNDGDQERALQFRPRFNVHDYWMAKYYAVAGVALAYLPDFFVYYEVDQGGLVPVLPNWRSERTAAWVIYPPSRHRNPRIKMVADTLCERFDEFIIHPGYSLISQAPPNSADPAEAAE